MTTHGNSNLNKAKARKNDEFYTRLTDVEKELRHYWDYFKGASILCNCDDPEHSQFFRYFKLQFEFLGLRKLVAVGYKINDATDTDPQPAYMEYYGKDSPKNSTEFTGSGDFRSLESIELLKQADIVVTNPPFSLFREYIAQLIEYDKKFLIIANFNSAGCKGIFNLFMDKKIWFGVTLRKGGIKYDIPGHYQERTGKKDVSLGNTAWYTNLYHGMLPEQIVPEELYTPERYPTYDNYAAIEVPSIRDIPKDYWGVMGVPVSYLKYHDPARFELVGVARDGSEYGLKTKLYTPEECREAYYKRHCKKGASTLNGKVALLDDDGVPYSLYNRVFIRRIK